MPLAWVRSAGSKRSRRTSSDHMRVKSKPWLRPVMSASCLPGGRAPTSEIATLPSGRSNHSMWLKPSCRPRAVRARGASSWIWA